MVSIAVSGVAYSAVCDPHISNVPTDEGWPTPTMHRQGRGYRAVYVTTPEVAALIESHLRDVGEGFTQIAEDAATRAEGRACVKAADRIAALLAALPGPVG